MKMTGGILALLIHAALSTSATAQTLANIVKEGGNAFATVKTQYSCADVDKIKFSKAAYIGLDAMDRFLLDATWHSCQTPADSENQPVIVVNPIATSDSNRVFYGVVSRKILHDAEKACVTPGIYGGASLSVIGTTGGNLASSEIGAAVVQYMDISCSNFSSEVGKGNMLAVLGPQPFVSHAAAGNISKDVLRKIPIVSTADKNNIEKLIGKGDSPPSITADSKHVEIKTARGKVRVKKLS